MRAEGAVQRPSRPRPGEYAQRDEPDLRGESRKSKASLLRGGSGCPAVCERSEHKKRNPRCRYPFSLDQQRALVLRRPAPVVRFRALQDPLPGFVPPLASLHASRRRAVPMRSFVRSNSGSGLAANRRNRITPRAPILPLTDFWSSSTSVLLKTLTHPPAIRPSAWPVISGSGPGFVRQPGQPRIVKEREWFYASRKNSQLNFARL